MSDCTITREYTRRGIDTVMLENSELEVEVLTGKGADITKLIDKRTNVNVLFEAPHEWHAPGDGHGAAPSDRSTFLDHYPGGWQTIIPGAGGAAEVASAKFGAHGESSIIPWSVQRIVDDDDAVSATLSTRLPRYPLEIRRTVSLEAESPTLTVDESVENIGEVPVEYQWLQHIVFGSPLVSPEAEIEVSTDGGRTDAHQTENARVPSDTAFEWPIVEGDDGPTNLTDLPAKSERVLEGATLSSVDGCYSIKNYDIDLAATVTYDPELFPSLWYWGTFGGYEHSPFFGREYALGLEPCTSSVDGLEQAIEAGATDELQPGECSSTALSVVLTRT